MLPLILASASPRRRELLTAAGFQFTVDVADVDERRRPEEEAEAYARRVARSKAEAVSARRSGAVVLGADTIVVVDGDVLGKPVDDADAVAMLEKLSGRAHRVLTAVSLVGGPKPMDAIEETVVWMHALAPQEIATYVQSGEPRDKAGAYGIQGLASRFIPRIEGSYTNVVGLPVAVVDRLLRGVSVVS
ncbi:MAG: septum formation inhibitor Maf [Acidimicrobiia bacterium]|nr:septum formation inhibitor Maf [Acidimicrobiia bacterium]